jgi:predicted dehydrogenase
MNNHFTRRDFISRIALGASALGFPSLATASPGIFTAPQKKLGIALVGLGSYSEFKLAPALRETSHIALRGIVTGTPAKASKWKSEHNIPDANVYSYETFDRIADNKEIDVVYVVLPNSMHHEFVIRAARAGKHVICEKPMAVSVKQCEEMIAACKKANVRLFVGYRMHFEPHTREAMRIGQKKEFGAVKIVQSEMGFRIGDPKQWRLKKALSGGGAMMDVGIYAIQGARYSVGEEPLYVTAQEFKTDGEKFKEVDETILWQMEFPGGAVSNSCTTYASNVERLFISAEQGWVELRPAFGYGPIKGKTSKGEMNLPAVNHQAEQLDGMALCIMENRETTATGEEGLRDMKVIEAIYQSIREGGKKIKIA